MKISHCRFFLVLLSTLILANCTHIETVPLNPNFNAEVLANNALSNVNSKQSFSNGMFEDKRVDTSKLATFKQQMHTYHLEGERPIKDVIQEGIENLINKSGHNFTDSNNSRVIMNVNLLNIYAARNAGMFTVGADSSIQVKIDFIDSQTNDVFYSEVYNGADSRDNVMVGFMGMVFDSLDASIVNCITNIGKDKALAKKLQSL